MRVTEKNNPELWTILSKTDAHSRSYEDHRRGSSFYIREIKEIKEGDYKGFYESDIFIWDDDYETYDKPNFTKVEQVVETVVIKKWIPITNNQ